MAFDGRRDDESTARRPKKTGLNPTDHGKQGVKRSLLTDGGGIPLAIVIDGSKRHDSKLVQVTLEAIMVDRPKPTLGKPQGLCLDRGYGYPFVEEIVRKFEMTPHIRPRDEEQTMIRAGGKHGAGWSSARTRGRTVFAAYSYVGKSATTTSWPCCILLAESSPCDSLGSLNNAY